MNQILVNPTPAQKTVGCCTHTTAMFTFLLRQLFVSHVNHQRWSLYKQIKQLSYPGFFPSLASIEEEAILDLYWLKSDSVNLSILSPVLVLQQCHPNKLQGCRKNCTRFVSIAAPIIELRQCTALLLPSSCTEKSCNTVLRVLLEHKNQQKHSHTLHCFVKKILRENVLLHEYFVFLDSEGTDDHEKHLDTFIVLISPRTWQKTNTPEAWTNMDYRRT